MNENEILSCTVLALATESETVDSKARVKRQIVRDVACIKDVGYYRRPIRDFDIVDPVTYVHRKDC